MMARSEQIVVVGASAAGLATVEGLRRGGFDGALTLVGDEQHLPYDRPPLSKQLLSGEWESPRLHLRAPEVYAELGVDHRLGSPAATVDADAHEVRLADGTELRYDALVAATGVRPRPIAGMDGIAGAHLLRNIDDALSLRATLSAHPHLVIVGGGFIGAEAAAVARKLGCEVTMVTDQQVPLSDAVGSEIGAMLTALHEEHGVRVVTEAMVERVCNDGERATGVRLVDGRNVAGDAVLVGIGTRPNVEWLADSGINVGNGVECDVTLHAGRDIWAAGDVASWPDPLTGERSRIEHRTNASEQGMAVARNLLADQDAAQPFRTVPYVWSDQYDRKIQIYGRVRGAEQMRVVDGSLADRKFTAVFGRDGRVTGALGINMVRPLRTLRALVAEGADWNSAMPAATA